MEIFCFLTAIKIVIRLDFKLAGYQRVPLGLCPWTHPFTSVYNRLYQRGKYFQTKLQCGTELRSSCTIPLEDIDRRDCGRNALMEIDAAKCIVLRNRLRRMERLLNLGVSQEACRLQR